MISRRRRPPRLIPIRMTLLPVVTRGERRRGTLVPAGNYPAAAAYRLNGFGKAHIMRRICVITCLVFGIAACDGPREQAGEKADNASGAVGSEDTLRSGPAETMGERQDEAAESAND